MAKKRSAALPLLVFGAIFTAVFILAEPKSKG
jgi:hypothetical protein